MGKNIAWFDALSTTQQYDLLFAWKREKKMNKKTKPDKKTLFRRVGGWTLGRYQTIRKKIEIVSYPPNFKHFLRNIKPKFSVSVTKIREAQLRHLLEDVSKSQKKKNS